MYGILLRLDAGRQSRVGSDVLKRLLSSKAYNQLKQRPRKLNASSAVTSPFAPTLIRPSFYPDYFRATDIRTLFWKVKNYGGLHGLKRVYVDEDSRVVFVFDDSAKDLVDPLVNVLRGYAHFEFIDPEVKSDSISFKILSGSYSTAEAGEVDDQ